MAEKKKRGNLVSGLIRQAGQSAKMASGKEAADDGNARIYNVLEYIEAPWGLNMKLFPAQRFIVKLYYNIPLDEKLPEDKARRIRVTDPFKTKVIGEFTEKQYLEYLYKEGRCNIGEQDGRERRELVLSIGRRGGKSTLSGIFASYEVYRLLNLYNPQAYYGLPNGNRIQILSVATNKDQAGLLFNEVTTHLTKCEYFKPYIANNTLSHVNFQTPYDIEKYGQAVKQEHSGKFQSLNGKATIRVTFKPCIARSLRGFGNVVIILDEVAHFQNKGGSSADEVYAALEPSAAAFARKDPTTGLPLLDEKGNELPAESRIILISSPLGRDGLFYKRYDLAMRGGEGAQNLLAIQAPTWEINPSVTADFFKTKFHADPATFMVEFGAQFSDQIAGWIERESDLQACIEPQRRPVLSARPRMPHQMGIDVGLVGDATAITITHNEGDKVVLDYHELWSAGVDWKESNPHLVEKVAGGRDVAHYSTDYAKTLQNVERLDFDEIANWIETLCKRFYITAGLFDRWNGIPLEQALHKKGLKQFTSDFFTRDQTSKMYQTAKMMMYDERLALYDWPIPEIAREGSTRHSPHIAELLRLQAQRLSKNIVLVAAPKVGGAHDDFSDALIRSIWLSVEMQSNSKFIRGSDARPAGASHMTAERYQIMRVRHHGMGDRPSGRALTGRALMGRVRSR